MRTSGSSADHERVAAGVPSRPISRTRPSSSGRRAASRNTERTTASTRDQPVPAAASDVLQGGRQLDGAPVDDRLEQDLLGREPVEDGLLADLEAGGQGVERRGLVAAGGEGGQGGVEDPLRGAARARPRPPASAGGTGRGRLRSRPPPVGSPACSTRSLTIW